MILCLDTSTFGAKLVIAKPNPPNTRTATILANYLDTQNRNFSLTCTLKNLYQQAQITPKQITKMIITLGPGSYTGIRSALSVLIAYRLALPNLEIFGVSNLELLAYHHKSQNHKLILGETKRKDFYWQIFTPDNFAITPPQAGEFLVINNYLHRNRNIGNICVFGDAVLRFAEQAKTEKLAENIILAQTNSQNQPQDLLHWHLENPDIGRDYTQPLYLKPADTSIAKHKRTTNIIHDNL